QFTGRPGAAAGALAGSDHDRVADARRNLRRDPSTWSRGRVIEKDFRALLPVWLSAVAAVALSHAAGRNWVWLGVAAYFLGAPAIGAYVFGHEKTHRPSVRLLTLPTPRSRIWLSKMLLALALVTPLTAIAMYAGPLRGGADARAAEVTLFTRTP